MEDGYFTAEEQNSYRRMLKKNSQSTGINIFDFYKNGDPESCNSLDLRDTETSGYQKSLI